MNNNYSCLLWIKLIVISSIFTLLLTSCNGDDGNNGANGAKGNNGLPLASDATALNIIVNSVSIASAPVVNFSVTNQDGTGVTGLTTSGLRFTIAKLMPTSPTKWQNYILTTQTGSKGPGVGRIAVQATRENSGTLVDNNDGSYRYTFGTDITAITCPAPCEDAFGNPLDVSYQPSLTHRLGLQTRGSLPAVNAVYTFRPSDGATTGITTRDIVSTSSCNECHDSLSAHDARIDTQYCVLCHNPGSQDPDSSDPAKDTTPDLQPAVIRSSGAVDFKIMIHKIHRGENLPSIELGPNLLDDGGMGDDGTGEYAIWGYRSTKHDFSDIKLPQDIRNCAKCHDGADADTPEGDNWKTVISMEACGSCHDNIKFGVDGGGGDPNGHPGGIVNDNSECITCHDTARIAGSVEESHTNYSKVGASKFLFEVLEICGTAVGADPVCAPDTVGPVVKFRVTDPTSSGHAFGAAYDVRSAGNGGTDPEFANSPASLNVLMAWNTFDYTNAGGAGTPPARANSVNARNNATSNGDGTFNIILPNMPAAALAFGSGVVAIEGHPATTGKLGTFTERATVKAQVAYFGITDAAPMARRDIVNITTKCDRCHDVLSVHGSNRSDEAQLCVTCHNPSNTDYNRRPKDGAGLLTGSGVGAAPDGKDEESIDFKRLIHGIHAASVDAFDGTIAHGFRENGLVVYGYGGSIHDFSHVRFPGVLSLCETCHLPDTYKLMDRSAVGGANWEFPAQNGVQGSTISTIPLATDAASVATGLADRADDLKISPIASVCSACHDGLLQQVHMIQNGGLFGVTQSVLESNYETCALCHGPGKLASVELVHSKGFGEEIP